MISFVAMKQREEWLPGGWGMGAGGRAKQGDIGRAYKVSVWGSKGNNRAVALEIC